MFIITADAYQPHPEKSYDWLGIERRYIGPFTSENTAWEAIETFRADAALCWVFDVIPLTEVASSTKLTWEDVPFEEDPQICECEPLHARTNSHGNCRDCGMPVWSQGED